MTPDKTVLYENFVKDRFLQRADGVFFESGKPVELSVIARFSPPKGASNKRRERMLAGLEVPTKRPDIDNIIKIIEDALNGVAYHDDSQITKVTAMKIYSETDGVDVVVSGAGGEDAG